MNYKPLPKRLHRSAADMKTINVEGVPEPITRALEAMVALLRTPRPTENVHDRPRPELPVRPGMILGTLTRDKIYGDAR